MITDEKLSIILRKLAKTEYWQMIYSQSREIGSMKVFENSSNFTRLQILFLHRLNFYYSIYVDIAIGDAPEYVLEDEIYEDAYIFYRGKDRVEKQKERKKLGQPDKIKSSSNKEQITTTDEWIMRTK